MSRSAFAPVTLEGRHVRLVPLAAEHVEALWAAGRDGDIFRWYTHPIRDLDAMAGWVRAALSDQAAGRAVPFATLDAATGAIIGSTRFGNIDAGNRRAEIGWTWVAAPFQRTAVNTEAKLLMLRHAFTVWGCARVELKTDSLNTRSREAILRIGATEEGTLRRHMLRADGTWRDTVYFSILDTEWPTAEAALAARLSR